MSALEEAREQARETLELIHKWRQREQAWDTPRALGFEKIGQAIRALLDATEPPTCSCQQVQECYDDGSWARSYAVVPDPECEAHTPTEPPEIQYADSATVAALAEKIAGENAELMERLAVKPAEDEREALIDVMVMTKLSDYAATDMSTIHQAVDAILAAGYRKGPRPITDEMVEAAAREYHERGNGEGSFARMSGHVRTSLLFRMKCALRAAEGARR